MTQEVLPLTSAMSSGPDIYLIHISILAVSSLYMIQLTPTLDFMYIKFLFMYISFFSKEPLLLWRFTVCISRIQLLQ